jgi:thymidine kinase
MSGELDLYIGCMFSGKSTELQRHVRRLDVIKAPYIIFNHSIDIRYGENVQCTHNKEKIECISLTNLKDIYEKGNEGIVDKYKAARFVFIEEAQFFGDLFDFVLCAINLDGKKVHLYGLDGDYKQEPFGDLLRLIPHADNVHKLKSFCKDCGDGTKGIFTIRDIDNIEEPISPKSRLKKMSENSGDSGKFDKDNQDKLDKKDVQILVGTDDLYKTVCRKHLLHHKLKLKSTHLVK